MSNKPVPADYVPDYKIKCQNCGQIPTVNVVEKESKKIHKMELCGPCCFGSADCLDPDNW